MADLLVDRPVGGHDDSVCSELFQFGGNFTTANDINRPDASAFSKPDQHPPYLGASRRLEQPFPRRDCQNMVEHEDG